MNQVWTTDTNKILESFSSAIAAEIDFSLLLAGGSKITARALKLHSYEGKMYFILQCPPDLLASQEIDSVFFKMPGHPILSFHCDPLKRSEKLLAFPVPQELFFVQRRQHPRFLTPQGSIAAFLLNDKERANVCLMKDISMGGAKLHGSPAYRVRPQDVIGPSTLTLSGYESLLTREITLQKAKIVRTNINDKMEIGLSFMLNNKEKQQLSSHLHYLTKESPFPFPESPFTI